MTYAGSLVPPQILLRTRAKEALRCQEETVLAHLRRLRRKGKITEETYRLMVDLFPKREAVLAEVFAPSVEAAR